MLANISMNAPLLLIEVYSFTQRFKLSIISKDLMENY